MQDLTERTHPSRILKSTTKVANVQPQNLVLGRIGINRPLHRSCSALLHPTLALLKDKIYMYAFAAPVRITLVKFDLVIRL